MGRGCWPGGVAGPLGGENGHVPRIPPARGEIFNVTLRGAELALNGGEKKVGLRSSVRAGEPSCVLFRPASTEGD